ncbi:Ipi1p Ecym_8009 [Eremothecium cymbalariae DBVPG|uniref:Pre-rRNA-processing protein n=1 Tax=Eremothecium cymbalariae (strain CBS 270.75 / DBVPG 7215 / KCTC 17166 / NRRL Y-17582) TaxID=931890 RepID=G8JXX9_ERECY|nr:Hypothetical protein Ecym_8009 [Eremothecium cymbalariae DBVPG\
MAKKKTLKQQDFQKKKLKVGKPKIPASNVTDASFVAKTIHLPNQTKLQLTADLQGDITRRLSLCKHHSDVTRKETLIYFQSVVPRVIHGKVMSRLMNSCIPLMCDTERSVRDELLKLFDIVGENNANVLKLQIRPLVLFISSAMTHISSTVQRDCGKFLKCIMKHCGDELVRCSWVKILKGMLTVLGWPLTDEMNPSSGGGFKMVLNSSNVVNINKDKKFQHHNIQALTEFIRIGCLESHNIPLENANDKSDRVLYGKYLIPNYPQPYAYLKLSIREFNSRLTGSPRSSNKDIFTLHELETIACEDLSTRRHVFLDHFHDRIMLHLPSLIKDGGDRGRSASSLLKLLEQLQQTAS